MARNLTSIPETDAPNAEYPSGRIRNEDSPIVGTPVIEELYGDIIQFFHKLVRLAGLTLNGLPDSETNTFQLIQALQAYIRSISGSLTEKGVWQSASNAETQAGLLTTKVVTPAGLESKTADYTRNGIIALATALEVQGGTSFSKAVTPGTLSNRTATTSRSGIAEIATDAEVLAGIEAERIVSPTGLKAKDGNLITKRLDIGDWNMQTTSTKFIAHGIADWTKIREIYALIRNDADNERHTFDGIDGHSRALSVNIELEITSSRFVSTDYNSTSYNRGFLIIRYLP